MGVVGVKGREHSVPPEGEEFGWLAQHSRSKFVIARDDV